MNRRRFLTVAGTAALSATGCELSFTDGLFNACGARLPESLRTHPLVIAAWRDLDPASVWDAHCHVFGNGDSGSGLWINPAMERILSPLDYAQRTFFVNAGCVRDSKGQVDMSFVARLLEQCETMPAGFRALLLGFDWARDESGQPVRERSSFHVPDAYVAALAMRYTQYFEWAASIHPYDAEALDRLDAAAALQARAVKWLPTAQGIDPGSPRCDRFYAKLADLRLPLITHAGDERAVRAMNEGFGNPLKLRRPLAAGVQVVIAHCASLGAGTDLDHNATAKVPNFDLFARLMDEPQYAGNLAGDISGITLGNRIDVIPKLLARRDWHARLRNGSDYPLPGVVPLISLPALASRGMLDPAAVGPLKEIRDHNILLFDFVLKRSLAYDGARFASTVFETRPYFPQAA